MVDIIARLSPHSPCLVRLGGKPDITPADIAHACINTPEMGYLIIQHKYSGDNSSYGVLEEILFERILEEATKNHWKRSRLPCLVKLAVKEYLESLNLKDNARAKYLDVHPSVWLRVWKGKYKRLLAILKAYEESALHQVRYHLK